MSGALTWARLSYRQQRWELILVAVGVALAAIGMLWFASLIGGMRAASPDCLGAPMDQGFLDDGPPVACQAILTAYYEATGMGESLLSLSFGAPFGMGVLLGAPLVAREIDGGTAQLAWSIGPSRTWWLARRIAFVVLFVVVLLGLLAVTSEILAAAIAPERNLSADFAWFGRRGWLIVARGVGALMLGMLVGAVVGRVLPSILVAILVTVAVLVGMTFAQDRWLEGQAAVHRSNVLQQGSGDDSGALYLAAGVQLPSGEVLRWEQLHERGIDAQYLDEQGRMFASEEDMRAGRSLGYDVTFLIPGSRYGEVVLVVGAASVALGLVALLGTAFVVSRRRPV